MKTLFQLYFPIFGYLAFLVAIFVYLSTPSEPTFYNEITSPNCEIVQSWVSGQTAMIEIDISQALSGKCQIAISGLKSSD